MISEFELASVQKKDGIVLKNVPKDPRPIFIDDAPFPIWDYNKFVDDLRKVSQVF